VKRHQASKPAGCKSRGGMSSSRHRASRYEDRSPPGIPSAGREQVALVDDTLSLRAESTAGGDREDRLLSSSVLKVYIPAHTPIHLDFRTFLPSTPTDSRIPLTTLQLTYQPQTLPSKCSGPPSPEFPDPWLPEGTPTSVRRLHSPFFLSCLESSLFAFTLSFLICSPLRDRR
jgi:hypothetical protein